MKAPPAALNEFELIAKYLAPIAAPGALGLVDDAAFLTPPPGCDLVLTKDALVAGVHFFPDDPPAGIARKALRVNLSDLAAKGARPLGFLLGLGLPTGWDEAWLAAFAQGLADDARAFDCPLFGGDTVSSGERLMLSVTAIGAVPSGRMVRRGGAQPGDLLYVSGTIGDGALGLVERRRQRSGTEAGAVERALIERYLIPQPRLALAPALIAHAHAAMDISDGLIGDAAKMATASGCMLILHLADVPLSPAAQRRIDADTALLETAVTGGDDYEILCAVAPAAAKDLEKAALSSGIAMKRIGTAKAGSGVLLLDAASVPVHFAHASYEHFSDSLSGQ